MRQLHIWFLLLVVDVIVEALKAHLDVLSGSASNKHPTTGNPPHMMGAGSLRISGGRKARCRMIFRRHARPHLGMAGTGTLSSNSTSEGGGHLAMRAARRPRQTSASFPPPRRLAAPSAAREVAISPSVRMREKQCSPLAPKLEASWSLRPDVNRLQPFAMVVISWSS
jgi:hypothetical protein